MTNDSSWRFWHLYLNALQQAETLSARTPEEAALQRLVLADLLTPTPATLAALDSHAASAIEQALAGYESGRARLRRFDPEGIEAVRGAIRRDRRLARAGYRAIVEFVHTHGTAAQRSEYGQRLEHAWDCVHSDDQNLRTELLHSPLDAIPAHWSALLRQALASDPVLDGLWVVAIGPPAARRYVAWVRASYAKLQENRMTEEALLARLNSYLEALCRPTDVVRALLLYSTEAFSPHFFNRLSALAGSEVLPPVTPVNRNILKIDSV